MKLIKATVIAILAALTGCAAHRKQARFDAAVVAVDAEAKKIDALARRLHTLTNIYLLESARHNLAADRRFLDDAAAVRNEERARLRSLVEIDMERVEGLLQAAKTPELADMAARVGSEEIDRLLQHTYELRHQAAELRYRR